jgi:hypothetical protein
MVAVSLARKILPGCHLHSDVHQSQGARSHRHGVLQKIAAKQKIDVLAPTTYRRELLPTYYTRSEPELRLLLDKLRLELPTQPPPKITGSAAGSRSPT